MTSGEVAEVFGVNSKTVTHWANIGKISCFRTPGGNRRFFTKEVDRLFAEGYTPINPDA
jgi:excisionase family DNA binding protein